MDRKVSQELVMESIDLQRVRPLTGIRSGRVAYPRRYGEVASSGRPMLMVRSEIGPYRRPRYSAIK
jgi:hypothetical protein